MNLQSSKATLTNKLGLLFRILVSLVALLALVWSAQLFMAGNAYYNVKNRIDKWQSEPESLSPESVKNAIEKIDRAIDLYPDNAFYLQMRGQVYEWRALAEREDNTSNTQTENTNDKALGIAFDNYRLSLVQRPNWSGSWIGLASTKWKKNELDDEFYQFLEMAIKTGPQDAILHRFIAEFGLRMFNARSIHYVKVNSLLKKHLALGLENPLSRQFVLETIAQQNAEQTVCRWLHNAPRSVRKRIRDCVGRS